MIQIFDRLRKGGPPTDIDGLKRDGTVAPLPRDYMRCATNIEPRHIQNYGLRIEASAMICDRRG